MKKLTTLTTLLLVTGCISPGKETKEALTDKQTFGWDEKGRFTADALGTHAHRFTMAQGVLAFNDDGTLDKANSQIEYYLEADPSAQAAATTAGAMAQLLAIQTQQVTTMLENTLGLLVPLLQARVPVAEEVGDGDGG